MLRTAHYSPNARAIPTARFSLRSILLLLIAVALPAAGFAAGEVTLTAGPPFGYFSENFSSFGTSATAALPTGWKVTGDLAPNWTTGVNTTATTQAAGTTGAGVLSGASGGGVYNFCNGVTGTANLDRALGFLTSGSVSSPRSIMLGVQNTTGETITSLTISWRYEKYRSGTRAFDWTFFGSTDGATWTPQALGNRSYAADANNTTISNPPGQWAHRVAITDLNIPNNGVYYFRWTYAGQLGSTNAQGLSIDNVELTPGLYYAYDDASDATYNATWANGNNGGFGWGAGWIMTSTGVSAESGFFTGTATTNGGGGDSNNDGDINTPNAATPFTPTRAFASYHNAGTPSTSAARPFPFALRVGDQVRVRMDNGNIASGTGTVGLGFRNAADQDLVQFYFVGGDTEYTVNGDGAAGFVTGMNFTDQGIEVILTLTSASTYNFRFQRLSTLGTTFTSNGTIETGPVDQGIARLRCFNFLAGSGTAANSTWNTPALIDPLAPKVTGIVRTAPGNSPTNASSLTYRVFFNEAMAASSIQHTDFTVSVVSGAIAGAATTAAVQASATEWDITVNTGTGDGVLRLDLLNTAVVTDLAGNRVGDSFLGGQTQIDKTAPVTQTSLRQTPAGPLTNATSVTYRVTFSEDVNNTQVDNADFAATVTSGSLPGVAVTGVAQVSTTTWDVTVSTGTGGQGTLRLDVPVTASVFDIAGNALTAAFTGGEEYNVDRVAPTVSSSNRQSPAGALTNATSVTYRVTFAEDISAASVLTGDFAATVTGGSLPGAGVTGVLQVNATSWDVTVSTGTGGQGDLRCDVPGTATISDLAGNGLTVAFTGGQVYNVDRVAPTVSGIAPVNGMIIDLTYSEGVDAAASNASNYTISGAGQGTVAANPSTAVFLSGTTYRLTWGAGSMINGQSVTVTVAGTIEDAATNPMGAPNFGTAAALPVELSGFGLE